MPVADFDELVELHKMAESDKEKIWVESELWKLASGGRSSGRDRPRWLFKTLGQGNGNTLNAYRFRTSLRDAPPELWDYAKIHKIGLHAIKDIYVMCRRLQKEQKASFGEVFQDAISQLRGSHSELRFQEMDPATREPGIAKLVALHSKAGTEREKAAIEGQLWMLSSKEERSKQERDTWLRMRLKPEGGSLHDYRRRSKLAKASPDLWDCAESQGFSLAVTEALYDMSEISG